MIRPTIATALFLGLFIPNSHAQSVDVWLTTPDRTALLTHQTQRLDFAPAELDEKTGSYTADLTTIYIDPSRTYQTIDGFGFALTGGSAQHIFRMKAPQRSRLLDNLFSGHDSGINISYLRVSIGASDLNDHVFSYDDVPQGQTDPRLERFTLQEDEKELIPVIKDIQHIHPGITFLGSPWSAPLWMKTNGNIQGGRLKEDCYPVYADYFVKYIQGMQQHGISINAITVQNEPFNDGNTPSMQVFAKEEGRFIRDYLGPKFQAAGITTKIILYDHNCDAPEYPISILTDPVANPFIDGSGFHLYAGPITAMTKVHDAFPSKNLYFTEMMAVNRGNDFNIANPVDRILIGAVRNWSRNVILWNLAANSSFQPHTDNGGCPFCQGAVSIDGDSVTRNIAYYTVGHFSRFVPPHSVRIDSNVPGELSNVAFRTPDGHTVLVVANKSKARRNFTILYNNKVIHPALEGGAVATYVWAQAVTQSREEKREDGSVRIASGMLEGVKDTGGIWIYRGIPYAQPPVGELRWKDPQPVLPWKGVRKADVFGPRPLQRAQYKDMIFRSAKVSEDCLYLNVWAPAVNGKEKLPVLVYFHGGGLTTGDGSETRYDGASMARKGIVTVTINYRLGIFGFFAHPSLTGESSHHSSGNYGLLDQQAALRWVQENIAAFGGDADKVTIAGQSAGSMSVSAQMASPLSKGLFAGAIGESGSMIGFTDPPGLATAEQTGVHFIDSMHTTLEALRKEPAEQLLDEALRSGLRFSAIIDGYFLRQTPREIFSTGRQMDVPLLAGWTATEQLWPSVLGKDEPTVENYQAALQRLYGLRAEEVMKFFPATNREEVMRSATDLATDRFLAYSTWRWIDLHAKTSGHPVYRFLYARQLPPMKGESPRSLPFVFAPHSADIAYALGNLSVYDIYAWTPEDHTTSDIMQGYLANFIKTGNPNGSGLSKWSGFQASRPQVMIIDEHAHQEPEKNLKRYVFLDSFYHE